MTIKTLQIQLANARARVATLEAKYQEARLKELQKVELVKNERSYTLLYNGRRINAARGNFGRLKVTENKKVIVSEYFGNVHDLRFAIAQGDI